jgi:hypothetical protein
MTAPLIAAHRGHLWTVNRPALLRRMLHHPAVRVVVTDVPDIAAHLRNPDKARSLDPAA